ncbi:hypothetical protein [Dactylosporangium sp. CA-092794]|uniref:hypothetical protein n=1 Tax=Dactylosporangium sp. CA-092794 TaxID=3239929 RepID=UPI003D92E0B4
MKLGKTAIAAAVALGAIAAGALDASPASASMADCTNYPETICMVENADWTGRVWRQYPAQIMGCRPMSNDNFDNKASIIYNSVTYEVGLYVYDRSDCTGTNRYFGSNSGATLTTDWWNDKVSSIRIVLF